MEEPGRSGKTPSQCYGDHAPLPAQHTYVPTHKGGVAQGACTAAWVKLEPHSCTAHSWAICFGCLIRLGSSLYITLGGWIPASLLRVPCCV